MALPQRSASAETTTQDPAPQPPLKLIPKPGRPSLFDPERTAAICAVIEHEGISDSAAGALAGVPSSTLARWKLEHERFALELERARALFELAQLRAIRSARKRDGSPDWRAAAWLLKHSSPEGYGPLSRRRRVKTDGVHAEEGAPGVCHAEAGQAQEREDDVKSENCAILPETRSGHGGCVEGNDRTEAAERARTAAPTAQNDAMLPETQSGHGGCVEGNGASEADAPACTAAASAQNDANLPETTSSTAGEQALAGPRLSRRERRAEARRLARARRVAA